MNRPIGRALLLGAKHAIQAALPDCPELALAQEQLDRGQIQACRGTLSRASNRLRPEIKAEVARALGRVI